MIHLMLVDDDKLATMIAEKMFERVTGKFEISAYLNSIDALDALKSKQNLPDAILLDINMPQVDGWSFLEQLNK
ncbi:MAG: response regulator, partial [Chitinophagales bacterium]